MPKKRNSINKNATEKLSEKDRQRIFSMLKQVTKTVRSVGNKNFICKKLPVK